MDQVCTSRRVRFLDKLHKKSKNVEHSLTHWHKIHRNKKRLNIVMEELPNWSCNDYSENVVMNSQFDLSDVWNCKAATCVKFVHSPLGGHTHSGNKELCLFCDDDVNEFRQMASKRLKTGRPWKLHPTIHSSINSIHPCICYVSAAAYLRYVYLRHNGIHAVNILTMTYVA